MSRLLRSPPPGWTPCVLGIALLLFLPAFTTPGEATEAGESTNATASDASGMTVLPTIRVISGNKVEVKVQDGKNITFQPGDPSGTIYFGETCMEDVEKVTDQVSSKVRELHSLVGPNSKTMAMLTEMENNLEQLGLPLKS
ncbi:uncharacterized protein [Branchiostoma lanceolatum]|uniref:uncharacterized protein isoform X1 n=1 Tax=Branchiostoma lanceolatum TaxID=7740 RepID=UPI0034547606